MDLLDQLKAQNKPKNDTPSAVWVALPPNKGIQYDIIVFDARQVPHRNDKGEEDGVQTLIKGILHFEVNGWKPQKSEHMVYPAGSEVSLYIDGGRKTDALVNAVKNAGLSSFDELILSRLIFAQDGELPPREQGHSPTKLYNAILYPVGSPEQLESPYIEEAKVSHEREESAFQAREAVMRSVKNPMPMASQGDSTSAAPTAAPIAAKPIAAKPVAAQPNAPEEAPAAPAAPTTEAPKPQSLTDIIGQ